MSVFLDHVLFKKKKHVIMRKYHAHPYLEIYYLKDGARFYINTDGKILKLRTGDFLFIPPGEMHTMRGPVTENYNLKIDLEDIPEELLEGVNKCIYEMDTISVPDKKRKYFENEFAEIYSEYLKRDRYDNMALHFMTLTFLADIARFAIEKITPFDKEDDDVFEKTLTYINENYTKPLSVETLSAMANMSKSYYAHMFKKRMGISPIDYRNKLRVNAAEEYILGGDMSMSEIAEKTGFKNASYFCTAFKKYMGISPNDYKATYMIQITDDEIFDSDLQ